MRKALIEVGIQYQVGRSWVRVIIPINIDKFIQTPTIDERFCFQDALLLKDRYLLLSQADLIVDLTNGKFIKHRTKYVDNFSMEELRDAFQRAPLISIDELFGYLKTACNS